MRHCKQSSKWLNLTNIQQDIHTQWILLSCSYPNSYQSREKKKKTKKQKQNTSCIAGTQTLLLIYD